MGLILHKMIALTAVSSGQAALSIAGLGRHYVHIGEFGLY